MFNLYIYPDCLIGSLETRLLSLALFSIGHFISDLKQSSEILFPYLLKLSAINQFMNCATSGHFMF